jgi:hypothetical protein
MKVFQTAAALCCLFSACLAVDLTLDPGTSGEDVVDAVVTKIDDSFIFGSDHRFLFRAAFMESNFGINSNTYATGFFGGIWQVTEANFLKTQDPALAPLFALIDQTFGIDWTLVTWEDLQKPLYSGLAFRLFLEAVGTPIPDGISKQGDYWKQFYNTDPTQTADTFTAGIQELERESTCFGRMNLEIVLDGSGSIGTEDFEKAKEFVADLVSSFSLASTRIGVIVYSSRLTALFPRKED